VYLDLGSGQVGPKEGYEGVDRFAYSGVDHLADLSVFPWPFDDDSVEGINCDHLVEHIVDLVGFMAEIWRVCKDGAEVNISHPYQFNVRAWQDPTHVRCLNEVTWFYFDKKWRQERNEFGEDVDFIVEDIVAVPEPTWQKISEEMPEEFERAARNLNNVISDLRVKLRCRKG
jgi:SAM-dependent methyltransferase